MRCRSRLTNHCFSWLDAQALWLMWTQKSRVFSCAELQSKHTWVTLAAWGADWEVCAIKVHHSMIIWMMLRTPAQQSLPHLMIQIELVTEVQWNNSTCAQSQYCPKLCRILSQHTWVLDAVGSHAHSLWLPTEVWSYNLSWWWCNVLQIPAHRSLLHLARHWFAGWAGWPMASNSIVFLQFFEDNCYDDLE